MSSSSRRASKCRLFVCSVSWISRRLVQKCVENGDSELVLGFVSRLGNYNLQAIAFGNLAFKNCPILSIEGGRRGMGWALDNATLRNIKIDRNCFMLLQSFKLKSWNELDASLVENYQLQAFTYRLHVKKPKELEYESSSNVVMKAISDWLSQ